jgi:hypothetical protein
MLAAIHSKLDIIKGEKVKRQGGEGWEEENWEMKRGKGKVKGKKQR